MNILDIPNCWLIDLPEPPRLLSQLVPISGLSSVKIPDYGTIFNGQLFITSPWLFIIFPFLLANPHAFLFPNIQTPNIVYHWSLSLSFLVDIHISLLQYFFHRCISGDWMSSSYGSNFAIPRKLHVLSYTIIIYHILTFLSWSPKKVYGPEYVFDIFDIS